MVFTNRASEDHRSVVSIGTDEGKPVKIKGHTLTPREAEECRRAAYGKLRGRQVGKELAVRLFERAAVETVERAIRETEDSENFTLGLSGGDVALYSKALGREVKAGEVVVLDGHWTEEVKRDLFENVEGLAKRIDDKFSKLALAADEEEEADTEDF